jgi:hypothetical protein
MAKTMRELFSLFVDNWPGVVTEKAATMCTHCYAMIDEIIATIEKQ